MKRFSVHNNYDYNRIIVLCLLIWITKISLCQCYLVKEHLRNQPIEMSLSIKERQIKNDIKEALRHVADNGTLDHIIPKLFNLSITDPTYVFLLPQNRKIVMRKSYFRKAVFPKISKAYIQLSRMANDEDYLQRKFDNEAKYALPKPTTSSEAFYSDWENDNEQNANAVLKNVQTERNFIEYMEKLNKKGASLIEAESSNPFDLVMSESKKFNKYYPSKYQPTKSHENDWDTLGLTGWKGELSITPDQLHGGTSPNFYNPDNKGIITKKNKNHPEFLDEQKHPSSSDLDNSFLNVQYNFLDNPDDNEVWDLPGKVSNDLLQLISEENEALKNMTKQLDINHSPNWPITNSRELHKDEDVFIGRANDPFGYSTKWQLRNSSEEGQSTDGNRKKRAVTELYSMIKCSTGCDPLIFKGYGCYCGFLGSGQPTDGIDQCCRQHDRCYGASRCPKFLEYFVPYIWKCYGGEPVCAVDHGEWGGRGSCATRLCKCDRQLSNCLRKFYCPRRRAVCLSSPLRMLQNYLMIF